MRRIPGAPKKRSEFSLAKPKRKLTSKYKRTTDYGEDWPEARDRKLRAEKNLCEEMVKGKRCNTVTYTVHHLIPRSKGGSNKQSNLKVICSNCHLTKHPHLR